ncbi:pyruvate decarboxylase [Fomitiporia mediterranea MF3/22]|uniref:pyruvate decarboxylase n=1 Tax=Fomitiporia mediterranea (strain MF3/22) TaxID=694068 RepID=UPI0004407DDE|nr:pyruvate decarboxylase [Fomitiporia mediterranea MF3/22]EJC98857.1 pyruvate decarboxylase [Fomitiporia mediterranea MF3/22]
MSTEEVTRLKQEVSSLQQAVQGSNAGEPIYVGDYLLARLEQLGVTQMFGVPGDFNLGFLDLVEDNKNIEWVGNCNELNAAYAADGYARVKWRSIGVLLTTFGVGELSAINGLAGAFSEHVPVLHIVGVPSTTQMKTKPMLHHTLGDGRFDAYEKAAQQFTIAQAHPLSKDTIAAEIDRVLSACVTTARPVYLTLPTDLVYAKIPSGRLLTPLPTSPSPNDPDVEKFVLTEILNLIKEAEGEVVILVDACAIRHHVMEETRELVRRTGFPVYSAPMGKGVVTESDERYGGIYVGTLTREDIKEKVESAKLIISIGSLKSDFNTGNFTYSIPTSRTIELHSDHTRVRYAYYPNIVMKHLLPALTARLEPFAPKASKLPVADNSAPVPEDTSPIITHDWFWPRMGKFFRPKDVIVAETGTSSFGILDVPLPQDATFVSQILWGSIGWTVGSTLGAAFAARDLGLNRTILFIGDGSLQLTVQEISTMIHRGLKPILFVLNNSGYTIERHLHGRERKYNDIANWKWTELLSVFQGSTSSPTGKSYTVNTKEELSALLDNQDFASAKEIQLVEIMMDKFDAPRALRKQAELSGKTNSYVPVSVGTK